MKMLRLSLMVIFFPFACFAQQVTTATCTNAGGDGAVIQNAINTGNTVHIVGHCLGDQSITINTPGQRIYGDGQTTTVITVSSVLTKGFFIAMTGEPGPRIEDLGINFVQPANPTSRADLIPYSPAFYMRDTPRFQMHRIRIVAPMVGVDMQGNSGGAILDDVEQSPLSVGIWIDGSEDSVRIDNPHVYAFGLSSALQNIFYAPNSTCTPGVNSGSVGAIGLYSGRVDDLKINGGLFLLGQAICFIHTSLGDTFGEVANTDFDTYGGIFMNQPGGFINASSIFASPLNNSYKSIYLQSGHMNCSSCTFDGGGNPILLLSASGTSNAILNVSNSFFFTGDGDVTAIKTQNSGTLTVTGTYFERTPNIGYTFPTIDAGAGTRVSLIGNRAQDKGTGAGVFVNVNEDNFHVVTGNAVPGWSIRLPVFAGPSYGVYACNSGGLNGCNTSGVWSPYLTIGGSSAGVSYSTTVGSWKINGNTVTVEFYIQLTSKGSNTGNVLLSGLPVRAASIGGSVIVGTGENLALMSGVITANVGSGSTAAALVQMSPSGDVPLTNSNLTNSTLLIGTATYFTY